jgi:hypothetical protein
MPLRIPLLLVLLLTASALAQEPSAARVIQKDQVVAGSPKDSLEVRHVVLRGSNEAIGRTLAEIARERYQVEPQASEDRLRTRAQRRYFEKNYPALHDRMRGVAAAFGKRFDDDGWNYSGLGFSDLKAGCSVFYLPPALTTTGTGIVSRDYDFTLGSMRFGPLAPGQLHPTARPYILELHPDRGYASIALHAYDLLSGVIDGMNSEGLTVALLADDELHQKFPMEPTRSNGVGLGALQMQRFLLDTCANVEEAKEALLQTKQYYEFIQVHYLIADRHGKAFVWEYSHAHNKEYIVEHPGQPLVTTNFSLHRHLKDGKPPLVEQAKKICPRYCLLSEQLATDGKLSLDAIKAAHSKVDAVHPISKARPVGRTFWHALYYPEERRAQFSFYLRDEEVEPNHFKIVRTDYLEFTLKP